jgi:hypothetical protein
MAFFICLSHSSIAQEKKDDVVVKSDKIIFHGKPKVSCQELTMNTTGELMTLSGNVSFDDENLVFENAGKMVWNKKLNKITVYNVKTFSIKGSIIIEEKEERKNILEYTIGDDKAYLL